MFRYAASSDAHSLFGLAFYFCIFLFWAVVEDSIKVLRGEWDGRLACVLRKGGLLAGLR